jgi:glucose-1-phosphatase
MTKKYDALIFDLGGVLYDIDVQRTIDAFSNLGLKDFEQVYTLKAQTSLIDALEKGEIDETGFVEGINKMYKSNLSYDQVKNAWNALLIGMPQESVNLLRILNSKGYRLYLLSNTNVFHYNSIQQEMQTLYRLQALDDLFHRAYYSFKEGERKPDIDFYLKVVSAQNLQPAHALFIDDNEENVKGAIMAGITSIHKKKDKPLLELLHDLDI